MISASHRPTASTACVTRNQRHVRWANPIHSKRLPGRVYHHTQCIQKTSSQSKDTQEVSPVMLNVPDSTAELEDTCRKISQHLELWLNEEWTSQSVHTDLAEAAAQAYMRVRSDGEHELGGVLLGVGSQLMDFDFRETFVNAFEVANKLAEIVMMMDDREVCCQSDEAKEQYQRVASQYE